MKYGIYEDLSNKEYHSDNGFISSSMLKLVLQSPEQYYKKYVLKETERESSDAMDLGTALHTAILEPHKLEGTVVFFSGRRQGKAWDEFKEKNSGKIILGDLQKMQLDRMVSAIKNNEICQKLLSGGIAEISNFVDLEGMDIKVRSDYLDSENAKIIDLKTTSGIISEERFRYNAESKLYGYDIQAALYVDAFSEQYIKYLVPLGSEDLLNKEVIRTKIEIIRPTFEFYWVVVSKDYDDVKVFRASEELIEQGRAKYKEAIRLIRHYNANGWKFEQGIIELKPSNKGLFVID